MTKEKYLSLVHMLTRNERVSTLNQRRIKNTTTRIKMLNLLLLGIGIIAANLPYIATDSVDAQNNGGGK